MSNFTFSEVITIVIVILIVFGPHRLPEIARKAGALAAKARSAVDSIKADLNTEYSEVIDPIRQARNEIRGAGNEVRGQITAFGKELEQTSRDVKKSAEGVVQEPVQGLKAAADKAVNQVAAAKAFPQPEEPASVQGDSEPPGSPKAEESSVTENPAESESG
ncbi:MAG: hypothetical protein HKN91_13935 [Acidimicrobiia bacterium]|nr:hypothetical protein [Acidimicrobiia bacterium]